MTSHSGDNANGEGHVPVKTTNKTIDMQESKTDSHANIAVNTDGHDDDDALTCLQKIANQVPVGMPSKEGSSVLF